MNYQNIVRGLHRRLWHAVSFSLLLVFAASFFINIAHASSAPLVVTGSATSITTTGATLAGSVPFANGKSVTQRGFQYGTDTSYGQNVSENVDISYSYASQWGRDLSAGGQFKYPAGITTDPSGNVYVADSANNRIQKFDSTGSYITQWGNLGTGNGQFRSPQSIAVDSSGNVYVSDFDNNRIQKFDSTGSYITQWGTQGSGNGQFNAPRGMAIDTSGNVYVVDSGNNRIQKFDSSGTYITKWGSNGTGNGQFSTPSSVTSDASGNIYVVDTSNNRIQKFDSSGTYLTQWGTYGSGNGQFRNPNGVTADSSGNIYVADSDNQRIQKFDSTGTYLTQWGSQGSANGQFYYPHGITTDSSGNIYVVDTSNNRIQKFDSSGTYLNQWGTQGVGNGQFYYPQGITTDSSGNVYVADTNNNRIQKFDSSGTYLNQWGTYSSGDNTNAIGGLFGIIQAEAGDFTATNTFAAASQIHGTTPDIYSGGIAGLNISNASNDAYFVNNYFDADLAGTTDCTSIIINDAQPLACTPISGNPSYFSHSSNPPMNQWDFTNIWMETPQYPIFSANVTANVALTAVPAERINPPKKPVSGGKGVGPAIVIPPLPTLAKIIKPSSGGTTTQSSENKSLINKLSDRVKQFLRNVPAPVLRAFPYLLFGSVAMSIGFMFIEMGRQARRLKILQALIAKQRAIAQQRDTFWHLAANYLRAPITLLMGGVELLTMSSPTAKSLGAAVATNAHITQSPTITKVAALVNTMQSKVSDIMQRIEGSQTLKDIDWPKAKPIRSVFFRIAFWLPLLAVAGLTLLANYVIHDFRKLNVSSLTYLTQAMLFILVAVGLYWILSSLGVVKNKRKDAEAMLAKQTKALHSARTDLVSSAASSLDSDVADLQLALKDLPKDSTATTTLHEGAERLRSMIDSFQMLSNAENGTLEKLSPVGSTSNLDTILSTTIKDEQIAIDAKRLTVDTPKKTDFTVPGTSVLNRQVIGSVLNNAIAFSPSKATIQLELLSKPQYQGIAIHDHGGGVSKEQLAHMFEPFTKADGDDALRMNHDGLGIDLYLNKLILQYLGGDISAESEEGKGTIVSIWWPKKQ